MGNDGHKNLPHRSQALGAQPDGTMPQTNPFWEPGPGRGTSGRPRPSAAGGAGSALREGREKGAGTVALAVRNSASWLMLDTSGELFMITRIRDSGSDTSRFSPPLNLAAIFPPPPPLAPALHSQPGERWGSRCRKARWEL